jgi:hypothetical protein
MRSFGTRKPPTIGTSWDGALRANYKTAGGGRNGRSFGRTLRHLELLVQQSFACAGLGAFQLGDQPSARRRIRRLCDLRIPRSEELLFLELDPLPRWAITSGNSSGQWNVRSGEFCARPASGP